jgi:hypothetical protein
VPPTPQHYFFRSATCRDKRRRAAGTAQPVTYSIEAAASCRAATLCLRRTRDASEGTILLLTLGCALAYATPHSPWTPVERACNPYAPCSQGKGAGGTMLDASGGDRAVTVFVALHAEGSALSSSVVQACLPWMVVPRNAKRDETAVCRLRGLETVRGDAGLAKLGRDGQGRHGTVRSGAPTMVCEALHARCDRRCGLGILRVGQIRTIQKATILQ